MKSGIIYVDKENNKKKIGVIKMEKIKKMVTEEEIKKLDSAIKEIYSIDYDNNHSVAYNLGFNTVANQNGSGVANLIIIADSLNDGGEDEAFARFILKKAFNNNKIERLKKELEINRDRYISILYL